MHHLRTCINEKKKKKSVEKIKLKVKTQKLGLTKQNTPY